jgi:plastocyanin
MNTPIRCGLVAAALLLTACAPDPHDIYTVDAPPVTRAPLPTTIPAAGGANGADGAAGAASSPEPSTFPATGEVAEVRALDNTFRLETIEVVAGTEVLWINGGRNEHNVLPVDEVADIAGFRVERDDFTPGDEYSHVFDTPGVFPYYCSIHGTQNAGMIGTVIVNPPA